MNVKSHFKNFDSIILLNLIKFYTKFQQKIFKILYQISTNFINKNFNNFYKISRVLPYIKFDYQFL